MFVYPYLPSEVNTHTHTKNKTKQQSPLLFVVRPHSQSVYLSISVKYTGLCDVHENKAGKVTRCLKAVSHYNICSHVKRTQSSDF